MKPYFAAVIFCVFVNKCAVSGAASRGLYKVISGDEVTSFYEAISLSSVTQCAMLCNVSTACVTATFDLLSKECQLSVDSLMSTIKTNDTNKKTVTSTEDIPICMEPLPTVAHGRLIITSSTATTSVGTLKCDPDYTISSGSPTSVNCDLITGWEDISGLACVSAVLATPDPRGYYGTFFVTGFMMNGMANHGSPTLMITCDGIATVRVEIPYLAVDEVHVVTTSLTLTYSVDVVHTMNDTVIDDKVVYVTSDMPVALYSANLKSGSADGSVVVPRPSLKSEYYIAGHPSTLAGTDQVVIIGLSHNTNVTFEYTTDITETITLNQNQSYLKQDIDLTGTRISASNLIFVLSGHVCANIPDNTVVYCDYIDEVAPPLSSLGTTHIVTYMHPRSNFTISIVVTVDFTTVNIYDKNGIFLEIVENLMKQDAIFRKYNGSKTLSVISNHPIMVHQYGHGDYGIGGDPSMMFIPDVGLFAEQYDFIVPTGFILPCMLTVVISSTTPPSSLKLNNADFTPVEVIQVIVPGAENYFVVYIEVQVGYNSLTYASGMATFGAWLYGRQSAAEFAWTLGYAV